MLTHPFKPSKGDYCHNKCITQISLETNIFLGTEPWLKILSYNSCYALRIISALEVERTAYLPMIKVATTFQETRNCSARLKVKAVQICTLYHYLSLEKSPSKKTNEYEGKNTLFNQAEQACETNSVSWSMVLKKPKLQVWSLYGSLT